MANTTKHEKTVKELFIGECWEYLRENFHKFNEANKIKIALELSKKSIPTELTGSINTSITAMGTIVYGGVDAEFNIGSNHSPENPQSPPEASSDN